MALPKIERQIRAGLPLVGYPPYGQVHPHSTGNRASTVQNEADYMGHKDINGGFYTHVVGNGRIIQVAEVNRGAYDVGGGWNQWGYASVELIESHQTRVEFERDYKIYVELIRKLADEAGIPKKLDRGEIGINTHDYCRMHQPNNGTDHVDPYPYLRKWGVSKEQFRKDIEKGVATMPPKPAQGDWIKENKRVEITAKNQNTYLGFDWRVCHKTNSIIGNQYVVTGKYNHQNGETYYSLYDVEGSWHGYINKKFVKEINAIYQDKIGWYEALKNDKMYQTSGLDPKKSSYYNIVRGQRMYVKKVVRVGKDKQYTRAEVEINGVKRYFTLRDDHWKFLKK